LKEVKVFLKKLIFLFLLLYLPSSLFAKEKRYIIPVENSPSYGPSDAPITIIEFIDYQ